MKITKKRSSAAKVHKKDRLRQVYMLPEDNWTFKRDNSGIIIIARRLLERQPMYYGEVMTIVMVDFGRSHNVISDLIKHHALTVEGSS